MKATIRHVYFLILAMAMVVMGYFMLLLNYTNGIIHIPAAQLPNENSGKYDPNPPLKLSLLVESQVQRQMQKAVDQSKLEPLIQPPPTITTTTSTTKSSTTTTTTTQPPPTLYIVTPTYHRLTQYADLMRLSQTLQLAVFQQYATIYWIVVEDAEHCSQRIRFLLEESKLPFAHLFIPQPPRRKSKNDPGHRGLVQRNLALDTIAQFQKQQPTHPGIVYFADDDNAYHVQLFLELSQTKRVSIFGVGLSGGSAYERCHVHPQTGHVDAILSTWKPRIRIPDPHNPGKTMRPVRKFPMDMAGFAFSTFVLMETKARFLPTSAVGMLETDFLAQLVSDVSQLQPLAANCTRILVWHVKTTEPQYYNNPESNERTFQLLQSML